MRRRRAAVPEPMDPASLPTFEDDHSAPIGDRLRAWEAWMAAFEAWQEQKREWYAAQGAEEPPNDDFLLIPDQPFDPDHEIAEGLL